MAGGTVRTIPSTGDSNSDAFQSLCLHLPWRTLRCPGIDRDSFFLTGPSLLSRATLIIVKHARTKSRLTEDAKAGPPGTRSSRQGQKDQEAWGTRHPHILGGRSVGGRAAG